MDNYLQELLFVILALMFILVLAWLLLKGIKGFHTQQGNGSRMKLMLTLPVGTRERLAIVNYRDTEYMIGITPGSINLIEKLPADAEENSASDS